MTTSHRILSLLVRNSLGIAAVVALAVTGQSHLRAEQTSVEATGSAETMNVSTARAMLDRYCVTCHNERTRTAELTLDTLDIARVGEAQSTWEHVIRRLTASAMPPAGRPRPDAATIQAFVAWLEDELDSAGLAQPDPGRPVIHRLNRVEYGNAVRDLLDIQVDVNTLLPADDEEHGFDNIADVLSISPTLFERYLTAAQRISRLAVGYQGLRPVAETYAVHGALDQNEATSLDLPLGSRGGVAIEHHFPVDGDYLIRVTLRKQEYGYARGMGRPHELDLRLDGARLTSFTVGRAWEHGQLPPMGYAGKFEQVYDGNSFPEWERYALNADRGLEIRTTVTGGRHQVGVTFDRRSAVPEGILPLPVDRSSYSYGQDEMQDGNPAVSGIEIVGPYEASGATTLPSRSRLFVCQPPAPADERACAGEIFSTLARRAYRRPTVATDIEMLLNFYDEGRAEGNFDDGIQLALERLLVDPEFLFRIENDPDDLSSGEIYRISDLELASRLSFFLWSSIPDDELLTLAERDQLSNPAMLDQQVQRLLEDPRSRALTENFGGQWLQLRKLRNAVPDTATYTVFDENLREAMRRETELFLDAELRADQPLVNLLRADYTFANDRLARHYGIPDVYGPHFRRVNYPDNTRGGLLGHASILTITSYANRTSPVVRGKWLLENILGAPPPPPPPDVPSLPSVGAAGVAETMRERLAQHRTNAICASCHNTIDPLGFALESYDAIGRFRTTDGGGTPFDTTIPIDPSGTLVDGTEVRGLNGLRDVVLNRQDRFIQTIAEKLLTYALGRTLDGSDMPVIRQIVRKTPSDTLTWSSLISGIVKSPPFLMRRSES